jgi:DNA polymerase-3 subunit alpha
MLDGTAKFKEYVSKLKEYNLPGMALTDHGNANGIYQFYNELKKNNLKPILGCEFYTCTDKELRIPNSKRETINKDCHQSIFIQNKKGYQNFNRLHYLANTEGYYYKPRITFEELFHYKEGLIMTTGCMVNIVNQLGTNNFDKEAEEWFKRFLREFGDNFYGEIQFNEILEKAKFGVSQKETNDKIIKLCQKYDVPILIGGDVHYLNKGDDRLQDIVINVARNDASGAESFIHARHLYFHNSEEIFEFNKKWNYNYCEKLISDAFDNSLVLLDKINFEFETVDKTGFKFPKYYDLQGKDANDMLKKNAEDGLFKKLKARKERGEKFPKEKLEVYKKRLAYELEIIKDKGFANYFLIFEDITRASNENNIRTGPGRGSCAGALLAYTLNITTVCPITHGLYFERFLNPARTGVVDIDQDYGQGGRDFVYSYLQGKYGKDCVIGVGTHQLYKAKRALQDAAKGLGHDTSFKSVLMTSITKIQELEEYSGDLIEYFDNIKKTTTDSVIKEWITENTEIIYFANRLMGQVRQIGTHAGGIVITPSPMWEHFPVTRAASEIVSAFRESDGSGKDLSDLGILKLDILGLSSLSIIQNCVEEIKKKENIDVNDDLLYPNFNDENVLDNLKNNNLYSIFQMDGGAKKLIDNIKPDSFEDICSISALNRPGPLETFGDKFGPWKRKYIAGKKEDLYEDPLYPKLDFMRNILDSTYGVLLYQEQFMFMVQEACGLDLGECDNFRRCIAWKKDHPKYYQVEKYFGLLEKGMIEKGYEVNDVKYFIDYCQKFLSYSFNLSHALSYSYISWQMLWLKTYYPSYYYASLFKFESKERYTELINDMSKNGIKLLAPRINKSEWDFNTLSKTEVVMGFNVIKSFGDKAYEELVKNNDKLETLKDFLTIDFSKINKSAFEALLNTGCFDCWGVHRNEIIRLKELVGEGKIETWFTRKKNALELKHRPDALKNIDDNMLLKMMFKYKGKSLEKKPWIDLIFEVKDFLEIEKDNLSLQEKDDLFFNSTQFSLYYIDRLSILNDYKKDINNYENFETLKDSYTKIVFVVSKIEEAQSKKGKKYFQLEISDGFNVNQVRCWGDRLDLKRNDICLGAFHIDKFGVTLNLKEGITVLKD